MEYAIGLCQGLVCRHVPLSFPPSLPPSFPLSLPLPPFLFLSLSHSLTPSSLQVTDGSVLHLVLNDDPYQGRPLHVKCEAGDIKTVYCGADFYIEDVKEELSCFPDQAGRARSRVDMP